MRNGVSCTWERTLARSGLIGARWQQVIFIPCRGCLRCVECRSGCTEISGDKLGTRDSVVIGSRIGSMGIGFVMGSMGMSSVMGSMKLVKPIVSLVVW